MKTLVVYDSFFGNTEKIAQAIAKTLESEYVNISKIKLDILKELDLLIVGSPTRAFRPSPNMTNFLDQINPTSLGNLKFATFDTRIDPEDIKSPAAKFFLGLFVSMFGYAAKPITKKLITKGAKQITEPEGFYVLESEGPLRDGELNRAVKWAEKIKYL